ncbi:hypothetical protein BB559_007170 [Furculomyces boomerangus]|uniref:Tyrosine--tRNA ligase n=2 Tax=Harpellales TaxID=61421 RepID=A0A2T9XYI3_9FUNG|nr:hypothetical protein BB559_007170 [Furculomyces boomerangus]PVZ97370.1 hypothetical protein BB558_006674 [Smittium angustum]
MFKTLSVKIYQKTFRRLISSNVIKSLRDHELVGNTSGDIEKLCETPVSVYCGVDPTASSMHLGNLITIMNLLHFHLHGHQVISLVGGATGSIGDPSGRSTERNVIESELLEKNIESIRNQTIQVFESATKYAQKRFNNIEKKMLKPVLFLNNRDWYEDMNLLTFLRMVGRVSRVKTMMARDSVKSRMEREDGISYTEFTYQLLQAYDFYYLNKNYDCKIQIGGSDQWGNIAAGIDLINKLNNLSKNNIDHANSHLNSNIAKSNIENLKNENSTSLAYGLTIPLLLSPSGQKYGKSAGNAIWLSSKLTSPYEMYQFFMRALDTEVELLLKTFTLLSVQKINDVIEEHKKRPEGKLAQKLLADEVVELIHGEDQVVKAQKATRFFFGGRVGSVEFGNDESSNITSSYIIHALGNDPRLVKLNALEIADKKITDIAVILKATKSKSEATRLIKNKGLYWNNNRVDDEKFVLDVNTDFVGEPKIGVLRVGKTAFYVIQLE